MLQVRRRSVFSKLPKWSICMKPALLWVRCPTCGRPHQEYFGPPDRDEIAAELQFLRRELKTATAIVAKLRAADRQGSRRGANIPPQSFDRRSERRSRR
jgi:hypothetical protein